MEETINGDQVTAILGISRVTLWQWNQTELIPQAPSSTHKRPRYPRIYIEGLAAASGQWRLSKLFTELYLLQESYRTSSRATRTTIMNRIQQLLDKGRILTTEQAMAALGTSRPSILRNLYAGTLRAIQISRRYYLPAIDIRHTATILGSLTSYEVATELGISQGAVCSWYRQGKLRGKMAINGELRFEPAEVLRFKQTMPARPDVFLTRNEVADILGVTPTSISNWTIRGLLSSTVIDGAHHYDPTQIETLRQQFNQLNPGFTWLQTQANANTATLAGNQVMRVLGVERISTFSKWTQAGLLPYFSRAPVNGPFCRVRDYHRLYIFGLKRHAANRPIKQRLLIEYRSLCETAQQIV